MWPCLVLGLLLGSTAAVTRSLQQFSFTGDVSAFGFEAIQTGSWCRVLSDKPNNRLDFACTEGSSFDVRNGAETDLITVEVQYGSLNYPGAAPSWTVSTVSGQSVDCVCTPGTCGSGSSSFTIDTLGGAAAYLSSSASTTVGVILQRDPQQSDPIRIAFDDCVTSGPALSATTSGSFSSSAPQDCTIGTVAGGTASALVCGSVEIEADLGNEQYSCTCDAMPLPCLMITGVFHGAVGNSRPRVLELYATCDIDNLSDYGNGFGRNGGQSTGQLQALPVGTATAGTFFHMTSDSEYEAYFGTSFTRLHKTFNPTEGDDVVELYFNGEVVDVYGVLGVDGTGEPWEYISSWASRVSGTSASTTFAVGDWTYGGPNANVGETSNSAATNPWPVGTYTP